MRDGQPLPDERKTDMTEHRVVFNFEIDFSNGGGIQGQGFRLDIEGDPITDDDLAACIAGDLRLLMVGETRILKKRIIEEAHKRTVQVAGESGKCHAQGDHTMTSLSTAGNDPAVVTDAAWQTDAMYERPQGFRIQIETPSVDAFDQVFAPLSEDTRDIAMPPGETSWAERFTMFTDSFGTPWMLNFTGSRSPNAAT
jgi:uncharacterized glyoxalase superfamily protein PhnB